jgi:hypothetical protein
MDHSLAPNPDSEVKSSGRAHNTPLYRSARPELRIRSRHCHPPYIPDLTPPPPHPLISIFLKLLRSPWQASDLQQRPTWSTQSPPGFKHVTLIYFKAGYKPLCHGETNFNGDYVEVFSVPSATHVPVTRKSKDNEVAIVIRLRTVCPKQRGTTSGADKGLFIFFDASISALRPTSHLLNWCL